MSSAGKFFLQPNYLLLQNADLQRNAQGFVPNKEEKKKEFA